MNQTSDLKSRCVLPSLFVLRLITQPNSAREEPKIARLGGKGRMGDRFETAERMRILKLLFLNKTNYFFLKQRNRCVAGFGSGYDHLQHLLSEVPFARQDGLQAAGPRTICVEGLVLA